MTTNQAPRPGILTVTAFHTDFLDTYKFFIPYSETLCDEIGHIVAALNELAGFCREPHKLTTMNTKFSSVESVNEALAFWKICTLTLVSRVWQKTMRTFGSCTMTWKKRSNFSSSALRNQTLTHTPSLKPLSKM